MEHTGKGANGETQKQESPLTEGKKRRETDKTEEEIQKEYELMTKKEKYKGK